MPSSDSSLDLTVEDERLWFVGLLGIVVLAGVGGFVWTEYGPESAEIVVEPATDGDADLESADVTIERATDGGGDEVVDEGTVTPSRRVVYHTSEPGTYRVRVSVAGHTCERRLSVERTDDGIEPLRVPGQSATWACGRYVELNA